MIVRKPKVLPAIHPNQGLEKAYKKALLQLIQAMRDSVLYWLQASYKANEPIMAQDWTIIDEGLPRPRFHNEAPGFPLRSKPSSVMAQDATPAIELKKSVKQLSKRWQKNFNRAAPKLAKYFATKMKKRSDTALQNILRESGITVKFTMTPAMRDVFKATVQANVSLIKSIPQKYFTEIEGMVMRSVQEGRDLQQLTKDLLANYDITKKRAALIARDQNNKATASLQRARQVELGISQAIWMHSGGGKHPRPSHVKAGRDKVKYDITKGWYDPHEQKHILPGQLINCRCVSRPVLEGF